MDHLSITASVISLAAVVRDTVRLIKDFKDGGSDRIQIATEIKGLLIVLRSIEGFCETLDEDSSGSWIQNLNSICGEGGILECARSELHKLNETLTPKTGHQKLIQSVRWPISDKAFVTRTLQHVLRLKDSMITVLEQANSSTTQNIRSDTKDLHDALQIENFNAILEWLSPLNMLAKQILLTEACGEGSGSWLLNSKPFEDWKESRGGILWCTGIPGAGKTFMSSIVVQNLRDASKDQNVGIFMLYIAFNDPATQTIEGLLEALLKQIVLATNTIDPSLQDLYQTRQRDQTRPTRAELNYQIELVFVRYSKVYLVIDALDELLHEDTRLDLIESLYSLNADKSLMITSRGLPNIQQHFKWTYHICDVCQARNLRNFYRCLDCPDWDACAQCFSSKKAICAPDHQHMQQFHAYFVEIKAAGEDLEKYIQKRIRQSSSLGSIVAKKSGLLQEIVDTVSRLTGERFLLAKFHMDTLANLHRPSQVIQALKDLPSRIDRTYDQAMERINAAEQSREEAKAVLGW